MHTLWGVFKAVKMTGMTDRGGFYKFWYNTADLDSGEYYIASWKAFVPRGRFNAMDSAGNLLLTNRRLILEPYSQKRTGYGLHGSKIVVNSILAFTERKRSYNPAAWPLTKIEATPGDDSQKGRLVITEGIYTVEFLLSTYRFPSGEGHVKRRDEAANKIRSAIADARRLA